MTSDIPSDLPAQFSERLPPAAAPALLDWFEAHRGWSKVIAGVTTQSDGHVDEQTVSVDHRQSRWSVSRGGNVISSFRDHAIHTDEGVHPAEFGQGLTSVGLQMLLPSALPLWGRDTVDDSVPIYLEQLPSGGDLLVTFEHRRDAAQRSALVWNRTDGLFSRLVRFSVVCNVTAQTVEAA